MLAGGGAMALAYDLTDGLLVALLLVLMGAPVLLVSHLIARHRRQLGGLSWQLAIGVVAVLGLDLLGVQGVAMLWLAPREALALALMLIFSGVLAGYAAWGLSRDVTKDIASVRAAVSAVGEGGRGWRAAVPTANDEIGRLAEQVDQTTRDLARREAERDASEQARRDLVAAVSHDLRTPLNSLRLISRAIEDGIVDEHTLRRYLGQIAVNIASLDTLIEDLFELARIEAGDIQWSMEDLDIEQLMRETLEGIFPLALERRISLGLSAPPDLPSACANPEKVQRVLFNLLANALHHTPDGGEVTLGARENSNEIEIEVADSGSGIPVSDVSRVFEPLWRGGEATASRPRDGAGLGLPIARSIVQAHGGRIGIEETSPHGTRICFTLPRSPAGRG